MEYVKIGPEFFKKSRADYSNWALAWVREILQNSIDAKATVIRITIKKRDEGVTIQVQDDGVGMDEDIIRNKLLSLGSSGKNFENGAVGGFGKAKELLYFGQKRYSICTNDIVVEGEGGTYTLTKHDNVLHKGTCATIVMGADDMTEGDWIYRFEEYIKYCNVTCRFVINDNEFKLTEDQCTEIMEKNFGKIFKAPQYPHYMVARVNGIMMFTRWINLEYGLVVDLKYESLLANRDNLKWEFQREMNRFTDELASESKSAIRTGTKLHKTIYTGKRGRFFKNTCSANYVGVVVEDRISLLGTARETETASVARSEFSTLYDFVLESSCVVPEPWIPETFCDSAQWLAKAWAVAVWETHLAYGCSPDYTIGFLFEDELIAAHQRAGNVYFINPCDKFFVRTYERTRESASDLLSSAVHEFVHGLGYDRHDEGYASAITKVIKSVFSKQEDILKKIINPDKHELFSTKC